jgi:hypothetical protein
VRKLDEMWDALEAYQEQADADGHGESWRTACEARTVWALDAAGEDAGARMKAADPDWHLFDGNGRFTKRKWNDDYERIYVAGEALCSAAGALSSLTDGMIRQNADVAIRLIAQAQGIDEEDDT